MAADAVVSIEQDWHLFDGGGWAAGGYPISVPGPQPPRVECLIWDANDDLSLREKGPP